MQSKATHSRAGHFIAQQCKATIRNIPTSQYWLVATKKRDIMIKSIKFRYDGLSQIIQNNPQTVDPLNYYTKELSKINKKRNKTEEDHHNRYDLEVAAKIYWQNGIVIPTAWVTASLCKSSFKVCKISKNDIRSAFFPVSDWSALKYSGYEKIKDKKDIILNQEYRWLFPTKQGQVKVMKAFPMFDNWSFDVEAEYDDSILPTEELKRILEYAAKYNGFGDFRPTFGRAVFSVLED